MTHKRRGGNTRKDFATKNKFEDVPPKTEDTTGKETKELEKEDAPTTKEDDNMENQDKQKDPRVQQCKPIPINPSMLRLRRTSIWKREHI